MSNLNPSFNAAWATLSLPSYSLDGHSSNKNAAFVVKTLDVNQKTSNLNPSFNAAWATLSVPSYSLDGHSSNRSAAFVVKM
jgi:hypothetical protein